MMTNHQDQLIHPLLMRTIAPTHYPNRVVINEPITVYDTANEPIVTYQPVGALAIISAYIEPVIYKVGQEIRRPDQTIVSAAWNVALAGKYPTISTLNQVVDDLGRVFNIISINIDAFQTQTNIVAEIVT